MSSLIGSIKGFPGTEAVGLTGPAQFALALTAQAEFVICNQFTVLKMEITAALRASFLRYNRTLWDARAAFLHM